MNASHLAPPPQDDPRDDTWSKGPDLPRARTNGHTAVVYMVVGGLDERNRKPPPAFFKDGVWTEIDCPLHVTEARACSISTVGL